jgi:TolB protein
MYVVDADGTGLTRLTDTPRQEMYPTWSPDGTEIAFVSTQYQYLDVFVVDADGSGRTNLTEAEGFDLYPRWMPDGSQIVFLSARDGGFQFYTMNPDGSEQGLLDSGLPSSELSPASVRGLFFTEDVSQYGIYIFTSEELVEMQDTGSAIGEFPAWSPDGTQIAFHSRRDGNPEIYVMGSDRSGIVRLTDDEGNDMFPTWSPDGTQIAFQSTRDGNAEIYTMNADGTEQTRLTDDPASDTVPAWQP